MPRITELLAETFPWSSDPNLLREAPSRIIAGSDANTVTVNVGEIVMALLAYPCPEVLFASEKAARNYEISVDVLLPPTGQFAFLQTEAKEPDSGVGLAVSQDQWKLVFSRQLPQGIDVAATLCGSFDSLKRKATLTILRLGAVLYFAVDGDIVHSSPLSRFGNMFGLRLLGRTLAVNEEGSVKFASMRLRSE